MRGLVATSGTCVMVPVDNWCPSERRRWSRAVTDPAVQAEVDAHYQGIRRMWIPDAATFKALVQTYVDDAQWRATYDQVASGWSHTSGTPWSPTPTPC
ncbi:TipAS antibiotic-recognition domain-containing protein [Streptomyces chartreusis]|uniref:TipAS antibiotic-recognition domain-containing protein n=1 Tax=Streptomyces chartreusis TaxID=1969 RepID=UPI0036381571